VAERGEAPVDSGASPFTSSLDFKPPTAELPPGGPTPAQRTAVPRCGFRSSGSSTGC